MRKPSRCADDINTMPLLPSKFFLTVWWLFATIGLGLSPATLPQRVPAGSGQRAPSARARAKAPATGGAFYINSNYDYTTPNQELSIREALLLVDGGTGSSGLNRGLTHDEEQQTVGCDFDGSGHILGGCGPGEPNTIGFDSSLGLTPTISLQFSSLPPISNTQPTIISGWGAAVVIDGNGLANTIFQVNSNANQIEYLTIKNFTGYGILVGSNNNSLYAVSAVHSVSSGTGILVGGNGNTVNYSTFVANPEDGIDINGSNNKIGGSTVRQNGLVGITVEGGGSKNNVIGGPSLGNTLTGNVISDNGVGVRLEDSSYSLLAGDKIGTTANGLSADGNLDQGVELINSNANYIGDPAAAANIISGNVGDGVFIEDSSFNQVANDVIGASSALGALPNGLDGVYLGGSMTATVSGNTIAFNKSGGVIITDHTSPGQANQIENNTITANQMDGVYLGGYFSVVDNSLTGDSITHNGRDGIHTYIGAADNTWSHLSTSNNGGLGIYTYAGTAPGRPTITSATTNGIQWTIAGTATGKIVFNAVSVEVYLAAPDPTGFGEGQTYLGTAPVDAGGHWSFNTPDQNYGCFTAFETQSSLILATAASSDFSQNLCRVRLFLPRVGR